VRIVLVSPEAVPFAKTGGLADVAGALPGPLAELGHEVSVIMPLYRKVREAGFDPHNMGVKLSVPVGEKRVPGEVAKAGLPGTDVPVYFVECERFFDRPELYGTSAGDYEDNCERFVFFSRAVLQAADKLGLKPDVFHVNDWQSALVPVYLSTLYSGVESIAKARTLLTIHNLAYQGLFPHTHMPVTGLGWKYFNIDGLEYYGKIDLLKGGILYADKISTVSERYAQEIQTEEYGCGHEGILAGRAKDLTGIVNGIDYAQWSPKTDELIFTNYSADELSGKATCKAELQKLCSLPQDPGIPVIGMVSRLADQKGLDLLVKIMPKFMKMKVQLVILGTGQKKYHEILEGVARKYPEKTGIHVRFDNQLAHQIEAGSDIFLMPSRYEPCGLNQLYSLAYGTVPLVRATGGLADTITDTCDATVSAGTANGFSFEEYSGKALLATIRRAVKAYHDETLWKTVMLNGMRQDWSWSASAEKYSALYESMAGT